MSEQAVLWLLAVLVASIGGLLGLFARIVMARLTALEREQQSSHVSALVARFDATERSWDAWRAGLESDRKTLHSSHERRLDSHAQDLKDHGNRITRLERNGH